MSDRETDRELLFELFKDNRNHNRHHVTQRASMTGAVLVIAAAATGVVTVDDKLNIYDLPLSVCIMVLGIFGSAVSLKYGARSEYHWDIASRILKRLLSEDGSRFWVDLKRGYRYRLYYNTWFARKVVKKTVTEFWVYLHSVVFLMGLVLTIIIVVNELSVG